MRWYKLLNPVALIESFFLLHKSDGGKGGGDMPDYQATPLNLTSGFGTASYNPQSGQVGYTLNPQLSAIRDYFYNQVGSFQPSAAQQQYATNVGNYGMGLFNQAMNLDTTKMAQDYYNQQQANLAPSRATEEARLGDTLFKTGRTGYGTGYQGGGYVNPEQFALLKAREEANANMMTASEDRARSLQQSDLQNALRYTDAANTLRTQPLTTMAQVLGLGTGVENLGYNQLSTLGTFSQLQNANDQAAYRAAAAQAESDGKGGLGGLVGGVASGASSVFGQGLGQWASKSIFGNSPIGQAAATAASLYSGNPYAAYTNSYGLSLGV